ncbi:type II toxin-antitoxin system HicB family antitoxin [Halomarina pelagica]|uniref:type II toxin-antitoxin system HicB family antitoxin n=1 Tax=Halomarina pelagica TaxID=2961599 RepID=UPI0020C3C21A|nr:type II toxin-antitoxin system HicB family antitoxin [Halomarina sp. BND7]
MSTDSRTNRDPSPRTKITLTQDEDGWWTARDETRKLTTQGETRAAALESLDEVTDALETGDGRPPTDEELRECGIDPEVNRRAGSGDLPDVLK